VVGKQPIFESVSISKTAPDTSIVTEDAYALSIDTKIDDLG